MRDNPPDTVILKALRQVRIFSALSETHLAQIAPHIRRRAFPANHTLFLEGEDENTALYLIVTGHINILSATSSGKPVHLARRGPGEAIGELSLIDGKPRMADAVTAEPCELLLLRRADFIQCIERSPQMALNLLASLAERLRQAGEQMVQHNGLDVPGRVATALLARLEDTDARIPPTSQPVSLRVTHQTLAEEIGATRESVSRALAGLEAVHAIKKEGRQILVLDRSKLRQYSNR